MTASDVDQGWGSVQRYTYVRLAPDKIVRFALQGESAPDSPVDAIQAIHAEIEDLRGQVRELSAHVIAPTVPTGPVDPPHGHVPRHHRDKADFIAQLSEIATQSQGWDYKISMVCAKLRPKINEKTLKGTLEYHGLLVENSIKKSLDRFTDGGRLFSLVSTALPLLADSRFHGLLHICVRGLLRA